MVGHEPRPLSRLGRQRLPSPVCRNRHEQETRPRSLGLRPDRNARPVPQAANPQPGRPARGLQQDDRRPPHPVDPAFLPHQTSNRPQPARNLNSEKLSRRSFANSVWLLVNLLNYCGYSDMDWWITLPVSALISFPRTLISFRFPFDFLPPGFGFPSAAFGNPSTVVAGAGPRLACQRQSARRPPARLLHEAVERARLGRRAAALAERLDPNREPPRPLCEGEDVAAAHRAARLIDRASRAAARQPDAAIFDDPRGKAPRLEKACAPQPDVNPTGVVNHEAPPPAARRRLALARRARLAAEFGLASAASAAKGVTAIPAGVAGAGAARRRQRPPSAPSPLRTRAKPSPRRTCSACSRRHPRSARSAG